MYVMAAVHVTMLGLLIERGVRVVLARRRHAAVEADVLRWIRGTADLGEVLALGGLNRYPIGRVARAGLIQAFISLDNAKAAMDTACYVELSRVARWTALIRALLNTTVLLGLFGTLTGLMVPFTCVAPPDATSRAASLAKGISESLNCSSFGLYSALIGLLCYVVLRTHIDRFAADLEAGSASILEALRDIQRHMRLRDVHPMPPLYTYRD